MAIIECPTQGEIVLEKMAYFAIIVLCLLPSDLLNMQQLHATNTCCCPNKLPGRLHFISSKMFF